MSTMGLILAVVFLALWGGHWMPWGVFNLTDERGRLHRVLAYGYGCTVIFIGFVLWACAQIMPIVSVWDAVQFLGGEMIAAGLGTVMPRVVRRIHEYQMLKRDVAEYEQAIESR